MATLRERYEKLKKDYTEMCIIQGALFDALDDAEFFDDDYELVIRILRGWDRYCFDTTITLEDVCTGVAGGYNGTTKKCKHVVSHANT